MFSLRLTRRWGTHVATSMLLLDSAVASQMLLVLVRYSYLYLDMLLRVPGLLFCHAFAVCHKIWLYRRDFVAANLPKNENLKTNRLVRFSRINIWRNRADFKNREDLEFTDCRKSRS